MPISKITSTKRGKSAIAVALLTAATGGWFGLKDSTPSTPPPAVILATDALVKPWESLALKSYKDVAGIWTVCWGETRIDGKPVTAGMSFTNKQCDDMLNRSFYNDYYMPLTRQIKGFTSMPVGVQASMISGAYNFGVGAMVNSTAAKLHVKGKYREGCEAQTAYNKARINGKLTVVRGLVNRREMGDGQRIGEAELCVSGLQP